MGFWQRRESELIRSTWLPFRSRTVEGWIEDVPEQISHARSDEGGFLPEKTWLG